MQKGISLDALWSQMTPQGWGVLGRITLLPVLMLAAIHLIRSEIKQVARCSPVEPSRSEPPPLRLKTTEAQRAQW